MNLYQTMYNSAAATGNRVNQSFVAEKTGNRIIIDGNNVKSN